MNSLILDNLYKKYNIANLSFGIVHDKLGDLYEEYCLTILNDITYLNLAKSNDCCDSLEFAIFKSILETYDIADFSQIEKIEATNKIPHRQTRGLSKTDIIMTVCYEDKIEHKYAISCKQTYAPKMAFAEFDVNTICQEVGIENDRAKYLMLKHQTEKSAKNFTNAEKQELTDLLRPIAKAFVRWVVTGSTVENPTNLVYPTSIIKFKLKKPKDRYNINVSNGDLTLLSFATHTVEEYINSIMKDKNNNIKKGGFGTGLSWTYATGSGGYKIQFKA